MGYLLAVLATLVLTAMASPVALPHYRQIWMPVLVLLLAIGVGVAGASGGLNVTTAGSLAAGTGVGRMRWFMLVVQEDCRYYDR